MNHTYRKFELSSPGFRSPNVDLLWELAFLVRPQRPGWSGFMQMLSRVEHPGPASVMILPMIDMNPSDLSCVNTTLHFVVDHAKQYDVVPVLTFDQPLWYKARMIVENEADSSPLKSIVLRLGGFHTLMSLLGCVGHFMLGTGLRDTLEKIYASNTVVHIMSGKAVSRALRGHFLLDTVLTKILLFQICDAKEANVSMTPVDVEDDLGEDEDRDENDEGAQSEDEEESWGPSLKEQENQCNEPLCSLPNDNQFITKNKLHKALQDIAMIYDKVVAGDISLEDVESSLVLDSIKQGLDEINQEGERTRRLWLLYMKMISLIRKFIVSDRTSDWALHLEAMNDMLPFMVVAKS